MLLSFFLINQLQNKQKSSQTEKESKGLEVGQSSACLQTEIKPVWQEGTHLNEEQEMSLDRQAEAKPYKSL